MTYRQTDSHTVLHRTQLSPLLLFPNAVSQSHYDTQYKQYNQYNTQYKQYNHNSSWTKLVKKNLLFLITKLKINSFKYWSNLLRDKLINKVTNKLTHKLTNNSHKYFGLNRCFIKQLSFLQTSSSKHFLDRHVYLQTGVMEILRTACIN